MNAYAQLAIGCVAVLIGMLIVDIWRTKRRNRRELEYINMLAGLEARRLELKWQSQQYERDYQKVQLERAERYPADRATAIEAFERHGAQAQQEKDEK